VKCNGLRGSDEKGDELNMLLGKHWDYTGLWLIADNKQRIFSGKKGFWLCKGTKLYEFTEVLE